MHGSTPGREQMAHPAKHLGSADAVTTPAGLLLAMQVAEESGLLDAAALANGRHHAGLAISGHAGDFAQQSAHGHDVQAENSALLRTYAEARALALEPTLPAAFGLNQPYPAAQSSFGPKQLQTWAQRPHWPAAWGSGLLVIAFVSGLLVDRIGPGHAINLLAAPLLGLVAWNLASYLLLSLHAVLALSGRAQWPTPSWWQQQVLGTAQRLAHRPMSQWLSQNLPAPEQQALTALTQQRWLRAAPVLLYQLKAMLHVAAIAVAFGAIAALYWRGLTVDYRAGWESTLLSATSVQALLGTILQAAAFVMSQPLPDLNGWQAMQFDASAGQSQAGVPAGPWLHMLAITAGLAIVLPRTLLALITFRQARHAARTWPWTVQDAYQLRLSIELDQVLSRDADRRSNNERVHAKFDASRQVKEPPAGDTLSNTTTWLIVPFNITLDGHQQSALRKALDRQQQRLVAVTLLDAWPLEHADRAFHGADGGSSDMLRQSAPLFSLSATPELEVHGRWLQLSDFNANVTSPGSGTNLLALVDIGSFKQRFTGAEGARRLQQRQTAWTSMLAELGYRPLWVDLLASD